MTSVTVWKTPPNCLRLQTREVHVWRIDLDGNAFGVEELQRCLSVEERKRAERFYFETDRVRFIRAHGAMRSILGRYLGMDPDQIQLSHNSYCKPSVAKESGGDWIRYNLSHSNALALLAVTKDREIGIDLEQICDGIPYEEISERFFSTREISMLQACPASLRKEAFYKCWTRKEAYVKARGNGLFTLLDQFEVSLTPGMPAALLVANWDPHEASRWSMLDLEPEPGFVGAIAVEGHRRQLVSWEWIKYTG